MANKCILNLGDGNFSYSKSLVCYLDRPCFANYYLVTSSFDSRDDLMQKYPEARSTLAHLAKVEECSVIHSVDATQDLRNISPVTSKYEYIIFNFPHLGIEDCNQHASMMGHVLYRVKEALQLGGTFYLTLADEQSHNWKL
jgi:hypothetical protein